MTAPGPALLRLAGVGVSLIPALALIPAALLDRGPGGNLRATGLYVALTLWDPYTWLALGQSLGVAATVALGALILGVALGGSVGRSRFWGRSPLAILAFASIAVPPLCGAIGLRPYLGGEVGRWLALTWVDLAAAVPWVAIAVATALKGIDPAWVEAAAVAGASRWRMRRDLIWPLLRPAAARAAGTVFVLALVEPGAPLILGLRRTLAFQLVEAASRPAESQRAATLALVAILVAAIGRGLILRWGRREAIQPPGAETSARPNVSVASAARRVVFLAGWIAFALAPLIALAAAAAGTPLLSGGALRAAFGSILALRDDPASGHWLASSLKVGLLTATLAAVLSRVAVPSPLAAVPPLATAVGVLLIPGLFSAMSHANGSLRPFTPGSPDRPSLLLTGLLAWALATVYLPVSAGLSLRRRPTDHRLLRDAALAVGAPRGTARRLAAGPTLAPRAALAWFVIVALGALDTATPLLFLRTRGDLTVGPAVLLLLGDPGKLTRAAALATLVVAGNGLALGVVTWWSRPRGASRSEGSRREAAPTRMTEGRT